MPVVTAWNRFILGGAVLFGALTFVALSDAHVRPQPPLTISGEFKGHSVLVTAMPRSAGAIELLQWGGTEYIDASDHGRHLQSAVSFDGLTECDNPTEAGASRDGLNSSSSVLLKASSSENVLRTQSRMAYWLRLGQHRACGEARNDLATPVSSTVLTKSVRLLPGYNNVLEHRISFDLARPRSLAQFEVLTAYMPARFDTFYLFNTTASSDGTTFRRPWRTAVPGRSCDCRRRQRTSALYAAGRRNRARRTWIWALALPQRARNQVERGLPTGQCPLRWPHVSRVFRIWLACGCEEHARKTCQGHPN